MEYINHVDVWVPGTFEDYIQADRAIFDKIGVDNGFVMETALFGWHYKDQPAAHYDLLAEQLQDTAWDRMELAENREVYDQYYASVCSVMNRLAPHLYGFDRPDYAGVDYIEIKGCHRLPSNPHFVLRINYDTGIPVTAPIAL